MIRNTRREFLTSGSAVCLTLAVAPAFADPSGAAVRPSCCASVRSRACTTYPGFNVQLDPARIESRGPLQA